MATTPDCLTALVGLTRAGSACYPLPDPAPDGYTASTAGRYVDEVEGLLLRVGPSTNTVNQGAPADLYDRLARARTQAVQLVRDAVLLGAAAPAPVFSEQGQLGQKTNGQLLPPGTRALLTLPAAYRPAGQWRLTGLRLFTDVAVADAALLLDGQPVGTVSGGGNGGAVTGFPSAGLLVPLDGDAHTLEVVLPAGVRVHANKVFCFGCNAGSAWAKAVAGDMPGWDSATYGNGISITAGQQCAESADLLCYATGQVADAFRYPQVAQALAAAVQYQAAACFLIDLQASRQVSRYTMLDDKGLTAQVQYYQQRLTVAGPDGAGNYLGWLKSAGGLSAVQHPCFAPAPGPARPSTTWTGVQPRGRW